MRLKALLKSIDGIEVKGSKEIEITGISSDSRMVAPGNLFLAKKGAVHDGAHFIEQAVQSGASAIVTDFYNPFLKTVQIVASQPENLEALLAARYYCHPSQELFVVGVTGTKGKTTTTYLVRHLLEGLGDPCGLVGTVETVIREHRFPSRLTTHDAIYNQRVLRDMQMQGCRAVAFEVSSHGLSQGRVDEIDFDLALFTNLYPDHLDYHQTMERYAAAKKTLFERAERAIVNIDSPWGLQMLQGKKGLTFGIEQKGDLYASDIEWTKEGLKCSIHAQGKKELFFSPLLGRFNIYNLLGAIAVGLEKQAELDKICAILSTFQSPPGRLECAGEKKGIRVFVDHAHTEEALAAAIEALRNICEGELIVVFGCGGNRDPNRRKGMARAASNWADRIIITNDNPRDEDPEEICRQILSGFSDLRKVSIDLDRKSAIYRAIQGARPKDIVLLAGKGHERVQIFGAKNMAFNDAAVAQEVLHVL